MRIIINHTPMNTQEKFWPLVLNRLKGVGNCVFTKNKKVRNRIIERACVYKYIVKSIEVEDGFEIYAFKRPCHNTSVPVDQLIASVPRFANVNRGTDGRYKSRGKV